ncbi:hypothetical protein CL618_02805 [archaeon]|nr:hypothetical protein [archaeon]|tara:strand:+ start:690 stop:887 length:198 start_codon:yes stop_codon:yes gene_type:complete
MLIKLGKQAEISRIINGISFLEIEESIEKGVKSKEKDDVVSAFSDLKINFNVQGKVHIIKRLVRK